MANVIIKTNNEDEVQELKEKGYSSLNDFADNCSAEKNKKGVKMAEEQTKKTKKTRKMRSSAELIACYQEKIKRAEATVKRYKNKIAYIEKRKCADIYKDSIKSVKKMTPEQLQAFEAWMKANNIG